MKNKELAELFGTIADGFAKLSEYYSSEDSEQPKAVKKDKPVKEETRARKINLKKIENSSSNGAGFLF